MNKKDVNNKYMYICMTNSLSWETKAQPPTSVKYAKTKMYVYVQYESSFTTIDLTLFKQSNSAKARVLPKHLRHNIRQWRMDFRAIKTSLISICFNINWQGRKSNLVLSICKRRALKRKGDTTTAINFFNYIAISTLSHRWTITCPYRKLFKDHTLEPNT